MRPGIEATAELLQRSTKTIVAATCTNPRFDCFRYRPRSEARAPAPPGDAGAPTPRPSRPSSIGSAAPGLVDDVRFATLWVEERQRHAPRSTRLLRYELRTKGIDADSVEAATSEVDDSEAALAFALARARKTGVEDFDRFAARTGSALQRRGFSYSTAAAAVRAAWSSVHASPDPGH